MSVSPETSGSALPERQNAALILADGTIFSGYGFGFKGTVFGEICFNTSMTGYQEILTDPSYAGQIITFTFPHIGNVGVNEEDIECQQPYARGLIVRAKPTLPSNFRSADSLDQWLAKNKLTGIHGVDTRAITRHIRKNGAQNVAIAYGDAIDTKKVLAELKTQPSMKGLDLAKDVSRTKEEAWKTTTWQLGKGFGKAKSPKYNVVAIDYGVKQNILRLLADAGCNVTVVPAKTTAKDILKLSPDGVFLSNGPGDPAATGEYAIPVIKDLIAANLPLFGICLGHQMLGIALGGKTEKMTQGHRGANHPVQDIETGKVEITSQNHGFVIAKNTLPGDVKVTHISLFDQTIQGIRHMTKPIFSVQGHPEASPGPHDTLYLFKRFTDAMQAGQKSSSKKVKNA